MRLIVEPGLKSSAKPLVNTRPPGDALDGSGESERGIVAELEDRAVASAMSSPALVEPSQSLSLAGGLEDQGAAAIDAESLVLLITCDVTVPKPWMP